MNVLSKVGTIGYVVSMGGLDIATFAFLSAETKAQLIAVEAEYAIRIDKEPDAGQKKTLENERDMKLAQVLGSAAVAGGFMLISVAGGVRQLRGALSKKNFVVSDRVKTLAEKGDIATIRAELEGPKASADAKATSKLTPTEREFLAEVIKAKEQGVPAFTEVDAPPAAKDATTPAPKDQPTTPKDAPQRDADAQGRA